MDISNIYKMQNLSVYRYIYVHTFTHKGRKGNCSKSDNELKTPANNSEWSKLQKDLTTTSVES